MTADQYLRSLLAKYQVNANGALSVANHSIVPVLQSWRGPDILAINLSGSVAKGTANSGGNDMDLFIQLSSTAYGSLQDIYLSLLRAVGSYWPARAQNVSIGIQCGGYHFDLVPARLQAGYRNWYSLWRNRAQTWTQTDIELHVQTVAASGRVEEIRILKLWRSLAGLDLPSFILELATIEALHGRRQGDLANNVVIALEWIRDRFQGARLVDPSNSNNVVSNDMSALGKYAVAQAAGQARNSRHFSDFVW